MLRFALVAATVLLTGCAALKPVRGIPVEEYAADHGIQSRGNKSTIDLSLLVQTKPEAYRVGPEDVLAVYIPGVLGTRIERDDQVGNAPPINQPQLEEDVPTVGFPLTVRSDGTLPLPEVGAIRVEGMTLGEVEDAILRKYTQETSVLRKGKAQVIVSMVREREYEVLVVRQEAAPSIATSPSNLVNVGRDRKGAARMVKLRAYRNDVLHALAAEQDTDGLPGLDAENTIYVIRRRESAAGWPDCGLQPGETIVDGPSYGVPGGVFVEDSRGGRRRWLRGERGGLLGGRGGRNGGSCDESCDGCDACDALWGDPYADIRTPPTTMPTPQYRPVPTARPGAAHPAQPPVIYTGPAEKPAFDEMFLPQDGRGHRNGGEHLTPSPVEEPADSARYLPAVRPRGHRPQAVTYPSRGGVRGVGHSEPAASTSSRGGEGHLHMTPAGGAVRGQSDRGSMLSRLNPFTTAPKPQILQTSAADPADHAAALADSLALPPQPAAAEIPGTWQEMLANFDPTIDNPHVIKIPVRLAPGERPCFSEKDIILQDGDIVFVESRGTEVFYTGGLLGGGQYELPRDYDLRLIEALSIAQGPQNVQQGRSAGGNTALNGDVTESGSRVIVLRTLPGGARVRIEADVYKAITHPEEHNILIQPGDVLLVQYTCAEAVYAFVQKNFFESALFGFATGFVSADQ